MVAINCTKNGRLEMGHQWAIRDGLALMLYLHTRRILGVLGEIVRGQGALCLSTSIVSCFGGLPYVRAELA